MKQSESMEQDRIWRWLETPFELCRSDQNLLIDQVIFEALCAGIGPPTIRIYSWDTPVVSLGRLQSIEKAECEFPGARFVRRPTGGLAVAHGDDLTICIAAHESLLTRIIPTRTRGVLASYFSLLSGLVNTFREHGIETQYGAGIEACPLSADCFAHLGRCDVIDARTGRKILGSAQRRAGGFILQQMSIRPHEAVDIHSAEVKASFQRHYQLCLDVTMWQNETELLPIEKQRLQELTGSQAEEL